MSDHPIQREDPPSEQEPEYRTKRDVVEKHFQDINNINYAGIPKYPLLVDRMDTFHPEIAEIVQRAYDGLKAREPPKYVKEGVSGTYYLHDPLGVRVLVFKPRDEEAKAVNNPNRRRLGDDEGDDDDDRITISSFFGGIVVGGSAAREIAAYYLDHPIGHRREGLAGGEVIGFAGVPPTLFGRCLHSKLSYKQGYEYKIESYKMGSLQKYMENIGTYDTWKEKNDRKKERKESIPVNEVHKLSVLDIRLANLDRHGGNILINKNENGQLVLIPIDHGYCIPTRFGGSCKFVWLDWPQAHACYSNEVIAYVNSLDADQDIAYLTRQGFKFTEKLARTLCISTMLLKQGVKKGLTPFEIGNLMCETQRHNGKTFIMEIVDEAEQIANDLSIDQKDNSAIFIGIVYCIMHNRLQSK